eukprot:1303815-Pleurochrysis_carterae.AAC.1
MTVMIKESPVPFSGLSRIEIRISSSCFSLCELSSFASDPRTLSSFLYYQMGTAWGGDVAADLFKVVAVCDRFCLDGVLACAWPVRLVPAQHHAHALQA